MEFCEGSEGGGTEVTGSGSDGAEGVVGGEGGGIDCNGGGICGGDGDGAEGIGGGESGGSGGVRGDIFDDASDISRCAK